MEQKRDIKKIILSLILLLYPLRHIHWGLDLMDTGYNYANFQYMGLDHMDPMWLYSTYLANVVGNFLMKLPFAGNLVGISFYTGLFISVLALVGFWFCTEKLHIPTVLAFVGEMIAISLCWCPTALVYNYLTYVLFLVCVILLYLGLKQGKKWYLFAAGICLGANVLVRFSNLPEMAMIVGVWAYAVIEGSEAAKEEKKQESIPGDKSRAAWKIAGKYAWNQAWRQTLWCLGGYLAALMVLFGYIQIRYGLDNYAEGIMRLFAMTDNATDYKATSMIMGVVGTYVENLYWIVRIGFFVVAGTISYSCVMTVLESKVLVNLAERSQGWKAVLKLVRKVCYALCAAVVLYMVWRLYKGKFCSLQFNDYSAMRWPAVTFLMLTIGIAIIRIFYWKSKKEERLISGLVLLVILLTSIGSNNGVFSGMNNLFVAAPYTLWECWSFFTKVKEWRLKKIVVSAFPMKAILAAFLVLFIFQSVMFGANFVFVETKGATQVTATVDNNEILKGVKMHPDRAKWMQEISGYVNENGLQGREVILYGEVPALSYYLQMPSAFNPWSDLPSYSVSQMEKDMTELTAEIENGEGMPVIIMEKAYADALFDDNDGILKAAAGDMQAAQKWKMIVEFMEKYNYIKTFENDKFVIWE